LAINAAWEGERGGEECCVEVAVEVNWTQHYVAGGKGPMAVM